jgi:flagellar protein FlaG
MNLDQTLTLDRDLKELFTVKKTVDADVLTKATELGLDKAKQELKTAEKTQAKEKQAAEQQIDSKSIQKSLESINQVIPIINTNLVFEFDDLNDPPIIKVIDKESKELIREIPSRELDKLAKAFSEMADTLNKSGALFNTEI